MTKKLAALLLMAILIVALATALGCGKKAEEGTSTGAPSTEQATNAAPAAPESGAAATPAAPAPTDTTKKK